MNTTIKRTLAATALAATGIAGAGSASALSDWAEGNVNHGVSCSGHMPRGPLCQLLTPGTKATNGNLIVVADVSTQRHDRNFTVAVTDLTTHKVANFSITANEPAKTFAVAGIDKGHQYSIRVSGWSPTNLDTDSGFYLRANG